MLFDPVYLPDLSSLGAVIGQDEWVLHAASQDLPCLAEVGLHATRVFDTELAGRLLGYAKVGLGSIVEEVLGLSLEKGHSAADWSTRPLPEPWIRYAALDVEVLVELRDRLAAQLDETGKRGWAEEEFAAIVAAQPATPRVDPWRRTSGMHRVRRRRDLAVVRALWERRDELAQQRDISPGRVLPDLAIVEAALAGPTSDAELVKAAAVGRPLAAPAGRHVATRDRRGHGAARVGPAGGQGPPRRATAGAQLGGARPRGRCPAVGRAGNRRRDRRAQRPARREPALPRCAAARHVGAARARGRGNDRRRPARPSVRALAGGPHGGPRSRQPSPIPTQPSPPRPRPVVPRPSTQSPARLLTTSGAQPLIDHVRARWPAPPGLPSDPHA